MFTWTPPITAPRSGHLAGSKGSLPRDRACLRALVASAPAGGVQPQAQVRFPVPSRLQLAAESPAPCPENERFSSLSRF